jgi:hypothetical protein
MQAAAVQDLLSVRAQVFLEQEAPEELQLPQEKAVSAEVHRMMVLTVQAMLTAAAAVVDQTLTVVVRVVRQVVPEALASQIQAYRILEVLTQTLVTGSEVMAVAAKLELPTA